MTVESVNLFWDILETPSLSEEAKIVVRNILKAKSTGDFAKSEWDHEREGDEAKRVLPADVKDWRLRSLVFHDFRSFPHYEDRPFGIDLVGKEGEPCSLFLLGSNGTGKSSIYTALESYYTGHASQAEERGVDQNRYLAFGFKEDSNYHLGKYLDVELADQNSVPNIGEISAPSSFCSLYDVQLLEQSKNGLNDFIFNQLGYGDVVGIDELLRDQRKIISKKMIALDDPGETADFSSSDWHLVIQEYVEVVIENKMLGIEDERRYVEEAAIRKEVTIRKQATELNLWNLHNRMFAKEWEGIEEKSEVGTDNIDLAEVQAGLVTGNIEIPISNSEKQTKRLANLFKVFFQYYDDQDTITKPYSVLDKLYERYAVAKAQESKILSPEEELNEKRKLANQYTIISEIRSQIRMKKEDVAHEFIDDFKSFIKEILQYFSADNEEFDLKIGENGICDVVIIVKPEGAEPFETTPREYFNSFRFVLYCVALKIALALNQMRKNRVSVPIVIDDVFDASDFENSLELEEFVYHIFRSYQKSVMEAGIHIPLQIILLTHDEMMKAAFERGVERLLLRDIDSEYHYICGRLIPYQYAKKDAMRGMTKLRDTNFYNLYIPL